MRRVVALVAVFAAAAHAETHAVCDGNTCTLVQSDDFEVHELDEDGAAPVRVGGQEAAQAEERPAPADRSEPPPVSTEGSATSPEDESGQDNPAAQPEDSGTAATATEEEAAKAATAAEEEAAQPETAPSPADEQPKVEAAPESAAADDASAAADTAPAPPQPEDAAQEAAPAKSAYTQADLYADLSIVQVTAQMGMVSTMLDALLNATFGLADVDLDDAITRGEAAAFAREHLKEGTPLAKTLGLSGGALKLDDEAAVDKVLTGVFESCDADSNGKIDRAEAKACRKYLYDLLASLPEPPPPPPPAAAAAGSGASFTGSGRAETTREELLAQSRGQRGGGGSTAQQSRSALSSLAPLLRPVRQQLEVLRAQAMRNLRQPNLNTFLAAIGLGSLALREALALDIMQLRVHLRGLIGGPLPDFLDRLRVVALLAMAAAAFGRFDAAPR